jgi:hypothetical protein
MSSKGRASYANAVRAAANDPNIFSFTMDIRRYMSGPVRVAAAISEAASAVDDKVHRHGDGIAVGYSHGSTASSETGDVNAIASTDDAQVPLHSDGLAAEVANAVTRLQHRHSAKCERRQDSGSEICVNCKQREIDDVPKKCGFSDLCSYCDESLWQTNADVICLGGSALALVAPSTCVPLSSLSLALPSEPASVAPTKRKRKVQANCSSESDQENVFPAPSKRKRNCVISSDDDVKNPYEGEAEEAGSNEDNESGSDEEDESDGGAESDEDNGSDGDSEFDSDGGDDEHGDDAHTGRRRIAVSEACAALRNRRRFTASQNNCPLCADLRVVLSHLLGLE